MRVPPRSLWWDSLDEPVVARPALATNEDVDVAIVGGGYTGLWTARELLRRDPSLRVCVLEQSVCGFGASGRNGGWASALFPVGDASLRRRFGEPAVQHLHQQLTRTVRELGEALEDDGVDAHYQRGGTYTFARSELQARRLRDGLDAAARDGLDDDAVWLDASELAGRATVSELFGAIYAPHCARVHPARLVRGLAEVVARHGVRLYEDTTVTRIEPARGRRRASVVTNGGVVRADVVVRATEGFTPTFPGHRRDVAPVYSLMIATEPLSRAFWERHGFKEYETFADDRHLIIYGQRTQDDRIAFGGRGAPYHFGSDVNDRFDVAPKVFDLLATTLRELFPDLDGEVTHRWGGPLAMPRDQMPHVAVDLATGLASAGGYTGDGVALSYLAGQTLADLITNPNEATERTELCFVGPPRKKWELEPARWLGINAGLALANAADRAERRRGTESRAGRMLDRLFA